MASFHSHSTDPTAKQFFHHSTAKRVNTDAVIAKSLKAQYPNHQLTIASNIDLLAYAAAGHATVRSLDIDSDHDHDHDHPSSLVWKAYIPPSRRLDNSPGTLISQVQFGKFQYTWQSHSFLIYIVDGRDGTQPWPQIRNSYILSPHHTSDSNSPSQAAEALIIAAGAWFNSLHDEIWLWDNGGWRKSRELYQSITKASWDAVILDEGMKKAIIDDHLSFFDSRETYDRLGVPWKRGIIYHGPPGNGKTISIKAMMHTLYARKDPVPALYVRNFSSYAGPEYAISQIFLKARQVAPCYLIFEDLDSLVTDYVRSYFLNEIDGLKNNDGIFFVGSTNHLDRLDPGIAKRPSRFDRKYYFPDPNLEQRVAYCHFWQRKLADNKDLPFPDKLCTAIAEITDGFSFAYIQEAFVAALLAIARDAKGSESRSHDEQDWVEVLDEDDDLDDLILWREIKKQVAILREGMEKKPESVSL